MNSSSEDSLIIENIELKKTNLELAKGNEKLKESFSQFSLEKTELLKKLLCSESRRRTVQCEFENYISNIDDSAKACIESVVTLSNHLPQLLELTNSAKFFLKSEFSNKNSSLLETSNSPDLYKTQVVKPMVGGHIIQRPVIHLPRINLGDLEAAQILSSSLPNVTRRKVRTTNTTDQPPEEEYENNEDESESLEDLRTTHRAELSTVEELGEDEESTLPLENRQTPSLRSQPTSIRLSQDSSTPLLSGFFRDVRLYVSPTRTDFMNLHPNITRLKRSSKFNKHKKSANTSEEYSVNKLDNLQSSSNCNNSSVTNNKEESPVLKCSPVLCITDDDESDDNTYQGPKISQLMYRRQSKPKQLYEGIDPLEGPSNLLDSLETSNDQIDLFSRLDLVPSRLLSNTSTPLNGSPALSVLKRRQNDSSLSGTTPTKQSKGTRKAKNKSLKPMSLNLESKVVLERLPLSILLPKDNGRPSANEREESTEIVESPADTSSPHRVKVRSSIRQQNKKSKGATNESTNNSQKGNKHRYNKNSTKEDTPSPKKDTGKKTSKKSAKSNSSERSSRNGHLFNVRPRRAVTPINLKEASLMKKLRRSK